MTDLGFSRRQALGTLSAGVAAVALPGCITLPASRSGRRPIGAAEAGSLIESLGDNLLGLYPESATSLALDIGARAPLRSLLTDRSPGGQRHIADVVRADLARAESVNTAALDHSTATSFAVVRSAYRTALEGFAFPYGDVAVGGYRNTPYVVIQNVGAFIDVPRFLDTDHPVKNVADAEAYLTRLGSYAGQLDGETERLRSATAQGVIPPAFLLDKAIKQLGLSLNGARKGGGLVDSLTGRTKNIAGDWRGRALAIATGQVAPALERQLAELQRQRNRATTDAGVWARPMGEAYYRWALKASTTTSQSPEEIHQLGLDQVRALQARMDPILRSLGYTKGSVGARMNALAKDPRYKFSDGDKGRAEIFAFIQERLQIIRGVLPRAFRTLVKGNLEVKRLPPEEEPGAPGAYGGAGSPDGTIPGKFWINLRSTDLHSKYSLPDLAAHEAIPGHVWQGEYANQLPVIRTLLAFNAYSEGWALYAQQLVDELGVYDDLPVARLGYLQSLNFRACRLVVDTGLHAKRWTREQGAAYFVEVNGSNPLEVANEVDRYCSWPGQACGYKVGHNEIGRLRGVAQAALGPKYDLRDYNDAVVKGGNVPLDVLAKNVDDFVSKAKAAAAV
ncbi:MAG: DUF885 domain-containing protein [Sphingomonas sp.]|uniref:DUF885 domain-containing protein n=1 Tax=Sphingomonas sp. TaxID=28214 RepID=UPI0017915558|nr:DUF885 domain-containing protein [Sphingomonas sp.]MBA3666111.1 DUF885 domain-containing protein [Sphingomonas sp.]